MSFLSLARLKFLLPLLIESFSVREDKKLLLFLQSWPNLGTKLDAISLQSEPNLGKEDAICLCNSHSLISHNIQETYAVLTLSKPWDATTRLILSSHTIFIIALCKQQKKWVGPVML